MIQIYVKVRDNQSGKYSSYLFSSTSDLGYFLLGYNYSRVGYSFEKKDNAGKTWVITVSKDYVFNLGYIDKDKKRAFLDGWQLWDDNHDIVAIRMEPYSTGYPSAEPMDKEQAKPEAPLDLSKAQNST